METINVYVSFSNEPERINVNESTTVENVITEVCKRWEIKPITKSLFALKQPRVQAWLNLSYLIKQEEVKDFEFAIRFNVPNTDRLKDIDIKAYDFYFKQAKQAIRNRSFSATEYAAHKSEIIGLSVIDMYRATIEEGRTRRDVILNYKKFVPPMVKKKHRIFLKEPIIKKFNEIQLRSVTVEFVKSGYLEQFRKVYPRYLTEDFSGVVNTDLETVYEILLHVDPFDKDLPGISIKYQNKDTVSIRFG